MTQSEALKEAMEIHRIFGEAVDAARKDNYRAGLTNPVAINGKVYYELPDGTLTEERPDSLVSPSIVRA